MCKALVPAVSCALVAVTSLVASPPASAGPVFQTRFHGELTRAAWTTCPDPKPGDLCNDTAVLATNAWTRESSDQASGGHFIHDRSNHVVLQRFWYEVIDFGDGQLGTRPIRESFGGTDNATVAIPTRLTGGAASATVPMTTFDYLTDATTTGTDSVSVTWLPAGPLVPLKEGDRFQNQYLLIRTWTKGWAQPASATGTLNGSAIPGSVIADQTTMIHADQSELSNVRGGPLG